MKSGIYTGNSQSKNLRCFPYSRAHYITVLYMHVVVVVVVVDDGGGGVVVVAAWCW